MTELELPRPCPVCGKRHKRGSGPYNAHLLECINRGIDLVNTIAEFANEHDVVYPDKKIPLIPKIPAKKTKTEEFFTREKNVISMDEAITRVNAEADAARHREQEFRERELDDETVTIEVSAPKRTVDRLLAGEAVPGEMSTTREWEDAMRAFHDEDIKPLVDDITEKVVDGLVESATVSIDVTGIKPPSGTAHLTVKPGNDIKKPKKKKKDNPEKGIYYDKNGTKFISAWVALCKRGKKCPECDIPDCETRVKLYNPRKSLLSRLRHRVGTFFHGSG